MFAPNPDEPENEYCRLKIEDLWKSLRSVILSPDIL